jgi:hypothetical protein
VITFIIAPESAPQVFRPPSVTPPPPAPPKQDCLEQRILDLVRECEPLKLWQALNLLAEEMSPRNRDEGREVRLNSSNPGADQTAMLTVANSQTIRERGRYFVIKHKVLIESRL